MTDTEVKKQIKQIIFKHLPPKEYRVFLYGSRVTGKAWKWSDYDVGIMGDGPVPTMTLVEIEDDLENSDLPVMVEVVDFYKVGESFKQLALQKVELWN
jgi:uncharacterized protein